MAGRNTPAEFWLLLGVLTAAGSVLVLLPFFQMVWSSGTRSQVMLLGSGLTVFGTLVSAVVGVLLFNRQQAARETERLERERSTKKAAEAEERLHLGRLAAALRAEVSESLTRLTQQFTTDGILEALETDGKNFDVVEASRKKDPSSALRGMPAGIALERNIIFEQHQEDIRNLPEPVIWGIVSYYQNDMYLVKYLNSMTAGVFDTLAIERQRKAVVLYRDLGQDTLRAGLRAKAILDAFLIQHGDRAPSEHDTEEIVRLAKSLMQRRPTDQELAQVLSSRQTRPDFGALLLSLPSDESTEHYEKFFEAVGLKQ